MGLLTPQLFHSGGRTIKTMSHSKTEAHIPCKIKQLDILFIPKYILILLTEEIKDKNFEIEKETSNTIQNY